MKDATWLLQQTSSICKFWQHVTSREPLTYIIRRRRGKMTLLYSWPHHNICQRRPIISCEPFLSAELLTERLQCTRCVAIVTEKYSCMVQQRVDLCRSDNVSIITRCQQSRQVTCYVYLTYDWCLFAWVNNQRCTMLDCNNITKHSFMSLLSSQHAVCQVFWYTESPHTVKHVYFASIKFSRFE